MVLTESQLTEKLNEKFPGPLRGTIEVSGLVRYEPAEGEFFLDLSVVHNLQIAGIPAKWQSKVNEAATRAILEFSSHAPVYRLKPTDIKKAAARLILQKVEVVDQQLRLTMGVG